MSDVRNTIRKNRRLYTYLDRAFTAIEALEHVPHHLFMAAQETERAGGDAAALRALIDHIKGLQLSEALERGVCAVDVRAADGPARIVAVPPAPSRRSMGFLPG